MTPLWRKLLEPSSESVLNILPPRDGVSKDDPLNESLLYVELAGYGITITVPPLSAMAINELCALVRSAYLSPQGWSQPLKRLSPYPLCFLGGRGRNRIECTGVPGYKPKATRNHPQALEHA